MNAQLDSLPPLEKKAAALKLEDNPVMSSCCNWELISNVSRDEYASQ